MPKFRSLYAKFLAILVPTALFSFAGIIAVFEWFNYQESKTELNGKLARLSGSQSLILAEPVYKSDQAQVRFIIASTISDPDVVNVAVYDKFGKQIETFGSTDSESENLIKQSPINYPNENRVEKVGTLVLQLTDKHIVEKARKRILYELLLAFLLIFSAIVTAYFAHRFTVGIALQRLLDAIKSSETGTNRKPVEWRSGDEMGHVIAAYNTMQNDQAAYETKLNEEIRTRQRIERELRVRESELREFLDGSHVMMWMMDSRGRAVAFNDTYLAFTGRTLEQELELEWNGETIHPEDRVKCLATYERSLAKHESFEHEYRCKNVDGEMRWLSEVGIPRFDADQRYQGHIGTCIDISDRKGAEQKLFEEKEHAQVTLESIGDAVIATDASGVIDYINPAAAKLMECTEMQARGRTLDQVVQLRNENTGEPIENPVELCLKQGKSIMLDAHALMVTRSGREFSVQDSASPIRDREGRLSGVVMVFSDVTESRRIAKELSYQASHDPLTGLLNRRAFESRLSRVLDTAHSVHTEHALCYLDLDQFKMVNDNCGHVAGDKLLQLVAALLQKQIRKRDTLARLGGDEFGLLIEHCSLDEAHRVASAMLEVIDDFRFSWEGKNFNIGVSIGVVPITDSVNDINDVLVKADAACYAAKDSGRNRIHDYREDDAELNKQYGQMKWVAQINHALETHQFHLVAQPILALNGAAGRHYELLIRMNDENGNFVLPGVFMPAAERYNLASKIDRWVIHEAFDWLLSQPTQLNDTAKCGINLSGHSLTDTDFAKFITQKFEETTIPPEKICFEITETAAVSNLPVANEFITKLKSLGCRFALDDFGSGFSSFAYLKNLPVDYLKIDGVFVKDIVSDPMDLAMVKSINEIGHLMGKETIAEFVEDEQILEKLKDIGVDYVQGWGVGRPEPLTICRTDYAGV